MGSLNNCLKGERSKESNQINSYDKAILKAKQARDKVKNYIKNIETKIKTQKSLAKSALKDGQREKAKVYLGRSKMYESQIEVGRGQLNLLEEQIIRIDQIKVESDALSALKDGNELLKKLQAEVSVEKFEEIRDDMNDIRDQQKEINDFFINQGLSEEEYDEEIKHELEKLGELINDKNTEDVDLREVKNKPKVSIEEKEASFKKKLIA